MDSSGERLGHDWNKFRDYINLINKLENLDHIIFVNKYFVLINIIFFCLGFAKKHEDVLGSG
jgi:hypothetical protein